MGLMNPPCLQIRLSALPFASLVRIVRQRPRFVLSLGWERVTRDVQTPGLTRGAVASARTGHAGRRRQARRAPVTHRRPPA